MHSAKLVSYVASSSTLKVDLWNMKLDQHGITSLIKYAEKIAKSIPWVLNL